MSNVPKLRFKGLVGEYKAYQLDELGEYGKSYTFSRAYEGEGKVHHIHYGDIHIKLPTIINDSSILPSITEKKDFQYVQRGDIVIADASEDYKDLGKAVCINDDSHKIISGLHTHRFSPDQKTVISDYLVRYMQTERYRRFIYRMGTGVSVLGLSKTNLSKFKLNLPTLDEQKKVSIFFNELEGRIERQKEKVELLKEQKKGYMQKIFNRELRFKDKDGKEFTDWKKYTLYDVVDRVVRKNKGLQSDKILTISAQNGLIDQTEYFNKTVASKNLEGYYLLKRNEFAYNKSYSNGYPLGVIKRLKRYEHGVLSSLYICFENNNKYCNTDFLEYYFESSMWHKEVAKISVEGARNHGLLNISIEDFFNTKHILPSLEEQEAIAAFFNILNEKLNFEMKKVKLLENEKRYFMQQMFI